MALGDYPIVVYPDRLTDDSVCYVADHPDLPGCAAHGDTIEEAKARLSLAKEAYLRHMDESGEPRPKPSSTSPTSIELESSPITTGPDAWRPDPRWEEKVYA